MNIISLSSTLACSGFNLLAEDISFTDDFHCMALIVSLRTLGNLLNCSSISLSCSFMFLAFSHLFLSFLLPLFFHIFHSILYIFSCFFILVEQRSFSF